MANRGIREEKRAEILDKISQICEENHGIAKASELSEAGIDYRKLQSFVEEGRLLRVRNGYYQMARVTTGEEEIILGQFPDGVLTMASALYVYGALNAKPFQWSIAVDKNTSKSRFKMEFPNVAPYYTEPEVLSLGVTEVPFGGGSMKIYEKERLVCDCLKYEEKLEREELQAAMRWFIDGKDKNIEKLLIYARARKVLSKVQNRIGVWM
jgi:predicted transcriptional regulator of viral defense system